MDVISRRDPKGAAEVERQGGIRLYGTIGGEAVLRPDGSIWFNELVRINPEEYSWRPATPREGIGALLLATSQFPELRELLPERRPDAPDCATCHGAGRVMQDLLCPACHGLGWLYDAA